MERFVTITAHRGGRNSGPENSLPAIERSLNAGIKSIEVDIHRSNDGHLVVCHDRTIDRTTNGKGFIGKMSFDELRHFSILDDEGIPTPEKLPELEEVLDLIDGRAELLLEIKRQGDDNPGIEKQVIETLKERKAESWTIIQSFNDSVLETIHSIDASIRLEKLLFCKLGFLPVIFDGTISYFSLEKYNYIESFNFYHKGLIRPLAEYLHENGKKSGYGP